MWINSYTRSTFAIDFWYYTSVRTAYKCRAYPDQVHQQMLSRTFGCIRVVWNRTLAARHVRYDKERKGMSYAETGRALTLMKRDPDLEFLNHVSVVPLQQALRRQQAAFAAFFGHRARYPRFKSRRGRQSATFTRNAFRMKDGELRLAKTGTPLRYVWTWPGIGPTNLDPTSVTVASEPDGRWFVTFHVEVPDPEPLPATSGKVGVDVGLTHFAVLSTGKKIGGTQGAGSGTRSGSSATSAACPAARRAAGTAPRPG